jgi:hypothetical protein
MKLELTSKAQREMEECWQLKAKAVALLAIVVAEWESDPTSVQCFDLRVVESAKQTVKRLRQLDPLGEY